jgi:hypothetical protein
LNQPTPTFYRKYVRFHARLFKLLLNRSSTSKHVLNAPGPTALNTLRRYWYNGTNEGGD